MLIKPQTNKKRVQRDAAPTLAPSLTTVPGTTMAETQALNQSGSSLDTADENADASKKQSSGTSSDQSEALINELDIMVENVDNVQVFSVYVSLSGHLMDALEGCLFGALFMISWG